MLYCEYVPKEAVFVTIEIGNDKDLPFIFAFQPCFVCTPVFVFRHTGQQVVLVTD